MPGGRPTTYDQETIDSGWAYVDQYQKYGHAFPSVVGLCKVINRSRTTIYDWASQDDNEFSYILEAINESQELVAWDKGMTGDYNASLVKLLLGKHGYHDKQDNSVSGPGGGPIEVDHEWTIKVVDSATDDNT